jgi:hypothetical protein
VNCGQDILFEKLIDADLAKMAGKPGFGAISLF